VLWGGVRDRKSCVAELGERFCESSGEFMGGVGRGETSILVSGSGLGTWGWQKAWWSIFASL
jgi:hypothetical protein